MGDIVLVEGLGIRVLVEGFLIGVFDKGVCNWCGGGLGFLEGVGVDVRGVNGWGIWGIISGGIYGRCGVKGSGKIFLSGVVIVGINEEGLSEIGIGGREGIRGLSSGGMLCLSGGLGRGRLFIRGELGRGSLLGSGGLGNVGILLSRGGLERGGLLGSGKFGKGGSDGRGWGKMEYSNWEKCDNCMKLLSWWL